MLRASLAVAGISAALAASAIGSARTPPLCGGAHPQRTYAHVIWIFLENQSYDQIIGSPGSPAANESPYVNRLASACGLATNYHNISHPSIPNYLALTSGSTHGVTSPCQPAQCPIAGPSLFSQIRSSGKSWRAYMESMPRPCDPVEQSRYAADHNPAAYYSSIKSDCARFDTGLSAFASSLATGRLPAFAYVKPDTCHDGDDCTVANGDAWLARWIPRIAATRTYRSGQVIVFISWDEGPLGPAKHCATDTSDPGCHVATLVLGRAVRPGTRSDRLFNHYGLLKTTEGLLGLRGFLGHAADPGTAGLRSAFGL